MSTPITDAVAKRAFPNEATSDYSGYVTMILHARRLETDRSALMEALELAETYLMERGIATRGTVGRTVVLPKMQQALAAAHANFPQP